MKPRASFTAAQVQQLLYPVAEWRVMRTPAGHAHLSQQDVTAHLIRILGFGGFDTEVREVECIFEHNKPTADGKPSQRWSVGYRALVRLTVRNPDGELVAVFEDGSTAAGQNLPLPDAHDLAYKSAISLALKRCAKNLGDQFGLSLYNKGQMEALVRGTLVRPTEEPPAEAEDVQTGVPQQVDSGDHDGDYDVNQDPTPPTETGLGAALADREQRS